MNRRPRSLLRSGAFILIAVYLGASAYLMAREDALVFPGAYWAWSEGLVPSSTVDLPWDTLRVAADDGASVFLLDRALE